MTVSDEVTRFDGREANCVQTNAMLDKGVDEANFDQVLETKCDLMIKGG